METQTVVRLYTFTNSKCYSDEQCGQWIYNNCLFIPVGAYYLSSSHNLRLLYKSNVTHFSIFTSDKANSDKHPHGTDANYLGFLMLNDVKSRLFLE